jgi:hypothetical protein
MEKCKYYNDSVTACSLMIDDLSNTACTLDGRVMPWNDWGYGKNNTNSLFSYFKDTFLNRYPEVKGTFFYLISKHNIPNVNSNYIIFNEPPIDKKFIKFVKSVSEIFDIAYHGTNHGKYVDINNPAVEHTNNWIQEFQYLIPDDIARIKKEIEKAENILGLKFSGGKYPGYKKNQYSEDIVESLGFKWWCSSYEMLDRKHKLNKHTYMGKNTHILNLPTNLYGNRFSFKLRYDHSWKKIPRILKSFLRNIKTELFIQYLYENRLLITVQQHFSNFMSDGTRQPPNIFDDIYSLERIYTILRGADIWHATCEEIAHYLESYDFTKIDLLKNGNYKIEYNGIWGKPFLSVKSNSRAIQNIKTKKIIKGVYKLGSWIYNNIEIGEYKEL